MASLAVLPPASPYSADPPPASELPPLEGATPDAFKRRNSLSWQEVAESAEASFQRRLSNEDRGSSSSPSPPPPHTKQLLHSPTPRQRIGSGGRDGGGGGGGGGGASAPSSSRRERATAPPGGAGASDNMPAEFLPGPPSPSPPHHLAVPSPAEARAPMDRTSRALREAQLLAELAALRNEQPPTPGAQAAAPCAPSAPSRPAHALGMPPSGAPSDAERVRVAPIATTLVGNFHDRHWIPRDAAGDTAASHQIDTQQDGGDDYPDDDGYVPTLWVVRADDASSVDDSASEDP